MADFVLRVDFKNQGLSRLGRALRDVAPKKYDRSLYRAINYGIDRFERDMKPKIKQWTGLTKMSYITTPMSKKRAAPGHWIGVHTTRKKFYPVAATFFKGVAWGGPATAGGTHASWNNPQLAKSTFMVKKYGARLYHRTGKGRFPIATIYGSGPAREMIRHMAETQATLVAQGPRVQQEAARLIKMEFGRVKAKYGL